MNVIKRDGRLIEFDKSKITDAILKAMNHTMAGQDIYLAKEIAQDIADNTTETTSVEQIQDLVEKKLMSSKRQDAAKEYIIYRNKRNIARGRRQYDIYMDIVNTVPNDITRENANMNADTPAGMMMKFASESSKPFVDDCLLSEKSKYFVDNNYIHVHDKDYYPTKSLTCLQHPLDYILQNGFRAGHGSSRPAKRIETASIIGCISMEQIQNEMHGGQSIPAFDFYLAPYVRLTYKEEVKKIEELLDTDLKELYDAEIEDYIETPLSNLTGNQRYKQQAINACVKRIHQSMEAFIHNMNTIHSRGGNQVVFSSINYGTDTSAEGRCIIREVLKSTYQGVGNGETPIFPIHIWKKKTGVNYLPSDRNYDLYKYACKVTAKRFFPNFLNLDASFNIHEGWDINDPRRFEKEVATMGCRTRVFENRHGEKTSIGRGNLSFTTINLVKLALECHEIEDTSEKKKEFFKSLQKCIDAAADQLYDRYVFQCTAVKKQFPMLMSGMWVGSNNLKSDESIESVLKHGTLGIGFIGLAEALISLTGHHHGEDEKSQELGIEIIRFMNSKIKEKSDYYDLNYSLLATPAEGLSGRFIKKDRKQFGSIPSITDKEYYTNSSHVPVWYKCSIEHKARIEAPYHEYEKGGHIFYVELDGDATHNPASVMQTVDLMDKYNIGYGSVNHTRNRCMDCGYEDASENLTECPECKGTSIDTIQRITGYLVGGTDSWNAAKKAELKDRVKHSC
ncbi:anaerobic ribonucleoside triphosphate reductase [Sedimentibacter saalensis]|uniref:Ribonucleoside-triphosphate reductase class III catalytic subunit n=1 Tax=Sedimentibacter saalensis TaxID=130788 RepID=A0A562J988_9FIRM|nr:anaerobic ribonucleoside triphosphate reductase [Sedimentibacter saalensis]TWH79752.1 ribonucleoside-triphosphate reductase class III catalytic subunit [Sedimentibacter saalensis]